jgi:hypothetical protein
MRHAARLIAFSMLLTVSAVSAVFAQSTYPDAADPHHRTDGTESDHHCRVLDS